MDTGREQGNACFPVTGQSGSGEEQGEMSVVSPGFQNYLRW